MEIRNANLNDLTPVRKLKVQIGAAGTQLLTLKQLEDMISSPHQAAFTCCSGGQKLAFLGMQFLPDSGTIGNFAVISHFGLAGDLDKWVAAAMLESHVAEIAAAHSTASILTKFANKRAEAGRFYLRQGYIDLKSHYIKNL